MDTDNPMNVFKNYPRLQILKEIACQQNLDVHLVGGFIRDFLMNRPTRDFDFTVSHPRTLAEQFARRIQAAVVILDEDRECLRVVKKETTGLETYDFTAWRADSLEEDLKLRDFTINTLHADLRLMEEDTELQDAIIDPCRALKDIEKKRIKRVSIHSIPQDPLRMLRAFSLRAQTGFRISLPLLNQIRKEKESLSRVSRERVREEFFKVLASPIAAKVCREMSECGILQMVIPQLRIMENCHQGGYHHLDVWQHSLEACVQFDAIVSQSEKLFEDHQNDLKVDLGEYLGEIVAGGHSRIALIRLAVLLHDIGKPATKKCIENRMTFHGHEHEGRDIVHQVCEMLKVSTHERHKLEDMVQMHLRPGYVSNQENPTPRMVFRYLRDAGDEAGSIALLAMADQRATRGPLTTPDKVKHHQETCLYLLHKFLRKRKEVPLTPLINGRDVMDHCHLDPSPLVGEILKEVQERQNLEELSTREEALSFAEEYIQMLENKQENADDL